MIDPDTRDRILASPEALLEDRDLMQALIGANDRANCASAALTASKTATESCSGEAWGQNKTNVRNAMRKE